MSDEPRFNLREAASQLPVVSNETDLRLAMYKLQQATLVTLTDEIRFDAYETITECLRAIALERATESTAANIYSERMAGVLEIRRLMKELDIIPALRPGDEATVSYLTPLFRAFSDYDTRQNVFVVGEAIQAYLSRHSDIQNAGCLTLLRTVENEIIDLYMNFKPGGYVWQETYTNSLLTALEDFLDPRYALDFCTTTRADESFCWMRRVSTASGTSRF